jgi:hypothetical protein
MKLDIAVTEGFHRLIIISREKWDILGDLVF